MVEYKDKLDEIFVALYGTDTDEYGEKYSEVYRYEVKGMEKDFHRYVKLMGGMPFNTTIEDLAKFVVWTECEHIGNTQHNKKIDFVKLMEIVSELMVE